MRWLAVASMIWLYGWIPSEEWPYRIWDLLQYRRMAEAFPGLAAGIPRPFAYRILGPWLAGAVPGPVALGFRISSWLAAAGLCGLMFRLLRRCGISESGALLAVWFLACNRYVFGFPVWNAFQLNDLLALVALCLLLLALLNRNWLGFGVALLVSVTARETPLLMVPVAVVYLWKEKASRAEWIRAVAACIPGVGCFTLLRLEIPVSGGTGLIEALGRHADKLLDPEVWLRLWLNTFLPFCLLPLVWWRNFLVFLRESPHLILWIGLVFLSALFGTNHERLMAPAALVFFLWLAQELDQRRISIYHAAFLCVMAAAASLHHLYGRWTLPDRSWTMFLSGASTLAVGFWGYRIRDTGENKKGCRILKPEP